MMDHKLSPKGWLLGPWKIGRFNFVVSVDDWWIGLYWGRDDGNLYFCPLPMLVFGISLKREPPPYLPDLPELAEQCPECGQRGDDYGGEYSCKVCGRTTLHDDPEGTRSVEAGETSGRRL